HEEGAAPVDHVEVGDDVPLLVPDEARAGALGDGELVEEDVLADGDVGDEDHRARSLLEEADGVLLLGQYRPGGRGGQGKEQGGGETRHGGIVYNQGPAMKAASRFAPERRDQTEHPPRCPVCGSYSSDKACDAVEPGFCVLRCPDCGFGRTWPPV